MGAPPGEDHWFNPVAAFLGPAYLRNAFTKGTRQEVDFLVDALTLRAGQRVLDAGCGPGRHALELARRGISVVGVDTSPDFLALARAEAGALPVEFVEADVRALAYDGEFDAVICLCQGGFGLLGGDDDELDVVTRFAAALRPGGRLAVSAFSSYFVVRHLEPDESFDAGTAVNHETRWCATPTVGNAPSISGRPATRRASSGSSPRGRASWSTASSGCIPGATRVPRRRSTFPSICSSRTGP